MIGVDDGLVNGKLDLADVLFLIGAVLAVIAAVLAIPRNPPRSAWNPVLLALAVALVALGFFVL